MSGIDEVVVTARIAKKLRERFDGLKTDNDTKLDAALTEFQQVAAEKVNARIESLDGDLTEKADALIGGLNNQAATKTNGILDVVKQYGQSKVDALTVTLTEVVGDRITALMQTIKADVATYLATVKKGDKGDKGDSIRGEDGQDGVGIKKIDQPAQDSMRITTTDGKETTIKLPKGARSGGGGGLSTIQEFFAGVENFPAVGRAQVTYFDTSSTPYLAYVWTGDGYTAFGGSGGSTAGYKDPTYTYTGDDLTQIDYATGEVQTFTYNSDGDVLTIDVTTTTGTTHFTFSYNLDGSLHDVAESVITP
jgi:hypothetical protein